MSEPNSSGSGRGALTELKDAVSQLFRQVTDIVPDLGLKTEFPRNELRVEDDAFRVLVELPGMSREEVDVAVTGRALRVSGERERLEPPSGGRLLRSERPVGKFDLSIHLPEEIDTVGVSARMRDGVLHIRLPKLSQTRGRNIEVEVEVEEPPRPDAGPEHGFQGPGGGQG